MPVVEEIGEYGGTIHLVSPGTADWGMGGFEIINFEGMFRIAPDGNTYLPNLAKDWEFSEDGRTLTLYLRKGIKWSDGVPFTTDDIMFWWEDIALNETLFGGGPGGEWSPGGEPMEVEQVDDYTVRLHFAVPYPFIMVELAQCGRWGCDFYVPKHYLKKFHIKYNPEADELAKEAGYDHWYQLFNDKLWTTWGGKYVGRPTLRAYRLIKEEKGNYLAERNPYYWKVDPAGNQLPYIDRVFVAGAISDPELVNGKIIGGEVDFECVQTTLDNLSLYKESAEKANYRVLLWPGVNGAEVFYQPNLTYKKDLVLRDIFRDVRFRRALSLAIDREEINEALFFGLAVPRQNTVIPQSKYYEPEFAEAYAQYDPEEANRLLDEMGLKWDENHEYRLRPDGKRLTIRLEYAEGGAYGATSVSELVKEYWKKIGINLNLKIFKRDILRQRGWANEIPFGLWTNDRAALLFETEPKWCVAMSYEGQPDIWQILWGQWYTTDGKEGEEPPEEIKKNVERWEKMRVTMDEEERIRLGKEILRSQAENLWTIGTVGLAPHVIIVRNNLRNVPEKALYSWDYMWTDIANPEQFFFKHPLLESQKR